MKVFNKIKESVKTYLGEYYIRLRILSYRHKVLNAQYNTDICGLYDMEVHLGTITSEHILTEVLEECYSDPTLHGESLDREGGNWSFEHSKDFYGVTFEYAITDGNCSGTEVLAVHTYV